MENERETGLTFDPKFDANDLLTAVVTDSDNGAVLMVGHMNAEAIQRTVDSRMVHFFSRSRGCLWKKGETSGNFLQVVEIMTDCDQDALWIKARPNGPTCHTGVPSCFFRKLTKSGLELV